MRKLLAVLLLISVLSADFILESATITISNIQADGSATVRESIKFIASGNNSRTTYDNGYDTDANLSYWSINTALKDVKIHTNTMKASITDFRLTPQPAKGCSPFLNTCHGELIIDYNIKPLYNYSGDGSLVVVPGTGLFKVEKYKPRVVRYSINPDVLSFRETGSGSLLLDPEVYLTIDFPKDSYFSQLPNPTPTEMSGKVPGYVSKLTWNDLILVKFSLVFEVEESIDKEVVSFFRDIITSFQKIINSSNGLPLIIILGILIGTYIYVNIAKIKRED